MKRIHLLCIIILRQLLNSHQITFIYYNMYSVHCKTFAGNITVPFSKLGVSVHNLSTTPFNQVSIQ